MYKIINNDSPSYLVDLLPYRVQEISHYNLRSRVNFEVPISRLCSYETSFIPSTLRLWNELDIDIRRSSIQDVTCRTQSGYSISAYPEVGE